MLIHNTPRYFKIRRSGAIKAPKRPRFNYSTQQIPISSAAIAHTREGYAKHYKKPRHPSFP